MLDPKRLGITDVALWVPTKRDVLLFDQIVIYDLEKSLSEVHNQTTRADWDYLASEGYVVPYSIKMSGRKGSLAIDGQSVATVNLDNPLTQVVEKSTAIGALAALYAYYNPARPPKQGELHLLTPRLNIGSSINRNSIAENASKLLNQLYTTKNRVKMDDVMAYSGPLIKKATIRSTAAELNSLDQYTAVPIIPDFGYEGLMLGNTSITDCFRLILQSLPVPDETIPWEEILDFRRDEQTRAQLGRLGRWIRSAIRRLDTEKVTLDELQDELAESIDSYSEHMRINKIKYSTSTIETIVTTGAKIAESIVKFKFSALAKNLFRIRHQQIALMEAELNAPGRELAYIVTANERFTDGQ